MTRTSLVAISTKAYFGWTDGLDWLDGAVSVGREHRAVADGQVGLWLLPSTPFLAPAVERVGGTRIEIGAQDVSRLDAGARTGETPADLLAGLGVHAIEVAHAERGALMGEPLAVAHEKLRRAHAAGLVALVCVGEPERGDPADAVAVCRKQLAEVVGGSDGEVVVAYEPVWAIGAEEPAPADHVRAVATGLRADVGPDTRLLYGGSAGPGLLTGLGPDVDGLFLGRRAHDPAAVADVLDEVAAR